MKPFTQSTLVAWVAVFLAGCGTASDGTLEPDAAPGAGGPDGGLAGDPDAGDESGGAGAPQGFSATATSPTTVVLSWLALPGAIAYLLERRPAAADFVPIATLGGSDTTFRDEGLTKATAYTYRIRAFVGLGLSGGVERSVLTPGGDPPLGGKSSYARIDAALASGTIDDETALTYKVFVTFKDPRLPAEFHGDDTGRFGLAILNTVRDRYDGLSPAAQATLEPFLIPPAYEGSWIDAAARPAGAKPALRPTCLVRGNWTYAVGTTGVQRVRVWYENSLFGGATNRSNAEDVAKALETEIWKELIDNVKLAAPIKDGEVRCNGQSDALDVYLVGMGFFSDHSGYEGITANALGCHQSPVYILVNDDLSGDKLKGAVAHEFMHAVQWAYNSKACKVAYGWMLDATANWAIDAVYPHNDLEHEYASWFLESPELSLDDMKRKDGSLDRAYGAYLFFQFLTNTLATKKDVVRAIWAATEGTSSSLEAVDGSIPGGFKEQWPKFAKALWNQVPVSSFEMWDHLTMTPTTKEDDAVLPINLAGQPSMTRKLDGKMARLAIHYYRFRVNDSNARSVAFVNHFLAVNAVNPFYVSTQAFVKKQNSIWEWEHWSDKGLEEATKSFCIDKLDERLTDLVIVMTNDSHTDELPDFVELQPPRISASNAGCWRYQGTTSVTDKITSLSTGEVVDASVEATVTFERAVVTSAYDLANRVLFYSKSGGATARSTKVGLGCTTTANGTGAIVSPDGSLTVALGLDLGIGVIDRKVAATGSSALATTSRLVCPPGVDVTTVGPGGWPWLFSPEDEELLVVGADGSIRANFSEAYVGAVTGTRTTIIQLTPQRE